MIADEFSGIDLDHLLDVVRETEDAHVQQRSIGGFDLTGCSCGVQYMSADPFSESRAHLRETVLVDTLRTLTGPCPLCRGSGTWRKLAGELTCPDCDGFGRTLLPLPPMQYRDATGAVWQVTNATKGMAYVDQR